VPLPVGLKELVTKSGLEPLLPDSNSDVLPLDDLAINKKPDHFGSGYNFSIMHTNPNQVKPEYILNMG
jgi:hypothetical protein